MKGDERQMRDVRNNVTVSGIGWIVAGLVSVGTGYVLSLRIQYGHPGNLIYIGVLLVAIGVVMLAARNGIAEMAFGTSKGRKR